MNNKKTAKIGAGNMANTKGKEKLYPVSKSSLDPPDDADIYGYGDETDYGYGEDQGGKEEADDSHSKLNYGYGHDGPLAICRRKPEAQQHSSHKRTQRRLSTGTMSCGSAYSNYSMDSQSLRVEDLLTGAATPVRRSSRRSSLSNSLHSSASSNSYGQSSSIDGSCDMDGITSIGDLKERSRSKKNLKTKRRVNRRSSLSSIYTSGSSHASSSVHSIHLEMSGGVSSTTSPRISNHAHSAESSLGAFSNDEMTEASGIDFMDAMLAAHHASHASSLTLPVTNVVETSVEPIPQEKKKNNRERKKRKNNNNSGSNKKDHIVESLVWFSFHIPRTVLEDLIAHELEVWKTEHSTLLRKSSQRSVGGGAGSRMRVNQKNDKSLSTTDLSGANDDEKEDDEDDDDGSLSSLSDEGGGGSADPVVYATGFSENLMLRERGNNSTMIKLPKAYERESSILFCDMSGFTKLSTVLDVESLSKVINSYFDMIVSEVIFHGGDVLKFCGDAFFAEWRAVKSDEVNDESQGKASSNPLKDLNASLASISEMVWDDNDIPPISKSVSMAARCATSIVKKFSDYRVTTATNRNSTSEAMLNVHCGVGVGNLVGLHVGDYKEGQEEDAVELRREFLLLGEAIDQVSRAADKATDGEVLASPEALLALSLCCDLTEEQRFAEEPILIASRGECYLKYDVNVDDISGNSAMQPYESLRMHCKSLNHAALQRLNLQMALYVHPVIRQDELALSAAIQAGKILQPTETLESRHRAEAELRSVYTMFISPIITPRITGVKAVDEELYTTLGNIMHVTSRELDRYSGHLRQFVVDDKGVVLIGQFGLRGSTFPNMVENNCLPATFAIHRALKSELSVDNRIGATFGKVYCGVVGGVRRHEFACMGAPVNLAARLMSSKVNEGILVDEAVSEQCREGYTFESLPPVKAKGYAKPVPIFVPIPESASKAKKKKSTIAFTGRRVEKRAILSVAQGLLEEADISQSSICFLSGESGSGKSRLAVNVLEELKKKGTDEKKTIITAKSSSTETEQRIPLSSYRKVFLDVIRVRCERDEQDEPEGKSDSFAKAGKTGFSLSPLKSTRALARRNRLLASRLEEGGKGSKPNRKLMKPSLVDAASQHAKQTPGSQKARMIGISHSLHGTLSQSLHGVLNQSAHGDTKTAKIPKPNRRESDALSQSVHRITAATDHARRTSVKPGPSPCQSPTKSHSMRLVRPKTPGSGTRPQLIRDDSSASMDTATDVRQTSNIAYFEKLCWACEKLDYPYEYADIVGSQFLGFESASPITHIDGHIPSMEELVEFLALAFICIADYADLTAVLLDDFQWVDSFSWKIFQVACKRVGKILLICATRSHDKQALRRITSAGIPDGPLQSQIIEISLGPLDFADIRELMSRVLVHKKSAIPDSLCTDIFQRTGGLPVYVVQLLENIRRKKTLLLVDGVLQWTAEGLKQKKNLASNKNLVMEETFLSRFDALDVRVRKVLQICAVLGLSFELRDVIRVANPEIGEGDIENSLNTAIDEMILVEQVEDDNDAMSVGSRSVGTNQDSEVGGRSATVLQQEGERYFQFSHAMWRQNVLSTMLKDRKIELHRLIAESMENDEAQIVEENDISRLLTLFDHWKAVGDFTKVAPLALSAGSRLEEWDLSSQSLELYNDALEMAYDGVEPTDERATTSQEWIRVKAKPVVLDLILRLHICVGLCYQRLGQELQSILFFEDAYNIIKTSSKLSAISRSLNMPIISSLCVLKLELEDSTATTQMATDLDALIAAFVKEAKAEGTLIHIGRSLAMEASFHAKNGDFRQAFDSLAQLDNTEYDVAAYTTDMVAEYGRDFVIEGFAESAQWLYLLGLHREAEMRAEQIIDFFLSLLDPLDIDNMMYVLLPIIQVFSLLERSTDALHLLKKHVLDPYSEQQADSDLWASLFNPLVYLLEIIVMDEKNKRDDSILKETEQWVLDEDNNDFDEDLKRKAHTIMGEICWRLLNFKDDTDMDPSRTVLEEKAREFLVPVACYEHSELFQKEKAQALLECL